MGRLEIDTPSKNGPRIARRSPNGDVRVANVRSATEQLEDIESAKTNV
jgi:hypothetical protein